MAASTTSTESLLLKQFWITKFLEELREGMVFYDLGMKNAHPMGEGTTVNWLALADLTAAAALTEATDPTEYTLSAGNKSASVKQYGASVLVSDLLRDTIISTGIENIVERLGRNAAKTMDIVIRDANFTAADSVQYAGTAVARNSIATTGEFDFDVAELREAINYMQRANVAPHTGNDYVAIATPEVVYDLQGDTNWLNAHIYTEKGINAIYDGEVGKLYGARFVQNTNALKMDASGSASTDVYQTYIVGHEAFGVSEFKGTELIVKDPHPASDLDLYASYGWKSQFATKRLNASALVRIESGASLGD